MCDKITLVCTSLPKYVVRVITVSRTCGATDVVTMASPTRIGIVLGVYNDTPVTLLLYYRIYAVHGYYTCDAKNTNNCSIDCILKE